jgi:16S rRNA (guanine527-N7)-methyltransferase
VLAQLTTPPEATVEALREAVSAFADPPDAPLAEILEYGALLLAANTVVNLTGARDWKTLVEAHLVDCVLAAAALPEDSRTVLDLGSGGGLPGLVWAALFPGRHFHLCERNGKKAAFLDEAAVRLGMLHVDVHARQGEEVLPRADPRVDLVSARAVAPLARLLPRLARGSLPLRRLLVMAGPHGEEEFAALGAEARGPWKLLESRSYALAAERGVRTTLLLARRKQS